MDRAVTVLLTGTVNCIWSHTIESAHIYNNTTHNTGIYGYINLLLVVEKIQKKNEGNGDIFMLTLGNNEHKLWTALETSIISIVTAVDSATRSCTWSRIASGKAFISCEKMFRNLIVKLVKLFHFINMKSVSAQGIPKISYMYMIF